MNQPPVSLNPHWEDKIAAEAMNFVSAVQQNFKFGLNKSLPLLPKNDAPHRAKQLDYFIDASIGVCVQCIALYANPSVEMEEMVKKAIGQKFAYIREQTAKAKLAADLKDPAH